MRILLLLVAAALLAGCTAPNDAWPGDGRCEASSWFAHGTLDNGAEWFNASASSRASGWTQQDPAPGIPLTGSALGKHWHEANLTAIKWYPDGLPSGSQQEFGWTSEGGAVVSPIIWQALGTHTGLAIATTYPESADQEVFQAAAFTFLEAIHAGPRQDHEALASELWETRVTRPMAAVTPSEADGETTHSPSPVGGMLYEFSTHLTGPWRWSHLLPSDDVWHGQAHIAWHQDGEWNVTAHLVSKSLRSEETGLPKWQVAIDGRGMLEAHYYAQTPAAEGQAEQWLNETLMAHGARLHSINQVWEQADGFAFAC